MANLTRMSVTGSLARTPDQQALADSIGRLLADRAPLDQVRDRAGGVIGFDRAGWRTLAEVGGFAAMLADDADRAALVPGDLGGVLEACGRALYDGPVAATVALVSAATDSDDPLVAAVAAGTSTFAILPTTSELTVDGNRVHGIAPTALDAPIADAFVVAGEAGCVVVMRADVQVDPIAAIDSSRWFGDVRFDHAAARSGAVDATTLLDLHALALCADGYGAAAAAFESAVGYANIREQFGQPIGRFQAVQHLLVDAFRTLRVAQLSVAEALETGDPLTVAAAVARCRDGLAEVSRTAIQVHGGFGYSWESDVQLFHKRCLGLQAMQPSTAAALDRVAAQLTG